MRLLTMILAGGEGKRLYPLTKDRSKPAVPFGGRYRIIDFVLSNFINSGFAKIKILTQFKSDSLNRHVSAGWRLSPILDQYIDLVPAQMRTGRDWYKGTADAIYQNMHLIEDDNPDYICVFGGDHIYKMDISQMLKYHIDKKADLTVSAIAYPLEKAKQFGVMEIDTDSRVTNFVEKSPNPKPIPSRPDYALVSMGNYIFSREALDKAVCDDATKNTEHDFGKNIVRAMIGAHNVFAYDFDTNEPPGMTEDERGYWRDVGDIDQYWETSMDLVSVSPRFNLYNQQWPIRCHYHPYPPAKFVFAEIGKRAGIATDSMVSEGCIISGGSITRTILSPHCRINSYSEVTESVLMEGVEIGRNARIRRAIIDKNVKAPEGMEIGFDLESDRKKFHVSKRGIVVVPKGTTFQGRLK
ncbi:Glucose-1-phosphate adenylyltransferase [hydrothermal vent metagenome]|uniref:Glucose-1-phosphate adenylyltransferase n=1 Tax=hydrothermal vent metagenome TaxID=652676 RepID=A0A3B1C686_9ZZZZ